MLLGYGLESYVCVGTVQDAENERDHVWVATRSGSTGGSVVFWESLSGQRTSQARAPVVVVVMVILVVVGHGDL